MIASLFEFLRDFFGAAAIFVNRLGIENLAGVARGLDRRHFARTCDRLAMREGFQLKYMNLLSGIGDEMADIGKPFSLPEPNRFTTEGDGPKIVLAMEKVGDLVLNRGVKRGLRSQSRREQRRNVY